MSCKLFSLSLEFNQKSKVILLTKAYKGYEIKTTANVGYVNEMNIVHNVLRGIEK